MDRDFNEILVEYDDLASDVSRSRPSFFRSNLQRWFSLLDDTPTTAAVIRDLEGSIDFDQWKKEGLKPQSGIGHGDIIWPRDTKQRLAALVGIFRSFLENDRAALQFAHSYVSSARTTDETIGDLIYQLYEPFSRDLRRCIDRARPASGATNLSPTSIPASDRIVEVDHNNPAHGEVLKIIGDLRELVRGDNAIEDQREKQRLGTELNTVAELVKGPRVRLALLAVASAVFGAIVLAIANETAGRLARNAVEKLLELIPALSPFLG